MLTATEKKCIKCDKPVEWDLVTEEMEDIFTDANSCGMESLT